MVILGIETSCDETAISIIETSGKFLKNFEVKVKANMVLSQVALHQKYGGVFPSLAKREHAKNLTPLFIRALEESGFLKSKVKSQKSKVLNAKRPDFPLGNRGSSIFVNKNRNSTLIALLAKEPEMWEQFEKEIPKIEKPPIDFIAVTQGPGLEPALWTGINFAKALSAIWNISIIPINHMEGHIFSSLLHKGEKMKSKVKSQKSKVLDAKPTSPVSRRYTLNAIRLPSVALLVSGGHTELVLMTDWFKYKILGATRDDAVGEAFDKVARILGLPYPGGPSLSALAERARTDADLTQTDAEKIKLPRPMINSKDYDFSFSGIKTAVLYLVKKLPELTDEIRLKIAQEFEDAVVETLVSKAKRALLNESAKTLILGGGVSANKKLREDLTKMADEVGAKIFVPEISHSTDNALMISVACAVRLAKIGGKIGGADFSASGNWKIDDLI